ncbi:MAG: YkgJ family cysteine cluster protein [Candidatus Omnitrophota bacterium]|nr:YkgJ family cysteine cluster protein [Candidatus Omnitrophota bacterium]
MKPFVPSQVCLSCDGCCRFKEDTSAWRPQVSAEEIAQMTRTLGSGHTLARDSAPRASARGTSPKLADQVFLKTNVASDGRLKAIPHKDGCICTFFNPQHNTCGMYHARPFDCQLYPFLLTRRQGRAAVCVHLNCPYVQEKKDSAEFDAYAAYLREFFRRADVRDMLEKHPALIGDYSEYQDELQPLFELDLNLGG